MGIGWAVAACVTIVVVDCGAAGGSGLTFWGLTLASQALRAARCSDTSLLISSSISSRTARSLRLAARLASSTAAERSSLCCFERMNTWYLRKRHGKQSMRLFALHICKRLKSVLTGQQCKRNEAKQNKRLTWALSECSFPEAHPPAWPLAGTAVASGSCISSSACPQLVRAWASDSSAG